MLAVVVVAAGLVHRPAIAAERDARTAAVGAVRDRVRLAEPAFAPGLGAEDVLLLEPDSYRVCVPGPDPERWLCHIVDVDRDPPRDRAGRLDGAQLSAPDRGRVPLASACACTAPT